MQIFANKMFFFRKKRTLGNGKWLTFKQRIGQGAKIEESRTRFNHYKILPCILYFHYVF